MEILHYVVHVALITFLAFILIGLGYAIRDGILDWQARRNLNQHLRQVEMKRKWRN